MRAIFIVGTGRSGTHFLTRILLGYRNIYDTLDGKENSLLLWNVALAAIGHRDLNKKTMQYYCEKATGNGVFLDQHHPNIFFAEQIAHNLNDTIFLFPDRPTCQVVASMMRHKGVMNWYNYATSWRRVFSNRVPYPNRFLGVTSKSEISNLPIHLLCAKRVIQHKKTFSDLMKRLPRQARIVDYQALVVAPETELARIFSEEERELLGKFELRETPQKDILMKYRDVLTDVQVKEIENLENESPNEAIHA